MTSRNSKKWVLFQPVDFGSKQMRGIIGFGNIKPTP